MTFTSWLIFFIIIQVIHFLGTWRLYQKAGRKSWEAAVPVYNAIVLTKIMNRPWWWVILLFIPIINLLMFPAIWVETARSFGKEKTGELFVVVLTLGFYLYVLNYDPKTKYNADRQLKPYTRAGEWTTAIAFAVVAASIIHIYFIRPYNIPTSSLEKTLLVGDFLFVSKMHYGPLVPQTPLSVPMFHDTVRIPFTKLKFKSYISKPQIPGLRLPGFQKVKRNDIVVFYWPTDTVRFFRDRSGIHVDKPVDKKSNYVKRCVAVAGDSLEIKNGDVYINGEKQAYPVRAKLQYYYEVEQVPGYTGLQNFANKNNITEYFVTKDKKIFMNLTDELAEELRQKNQIKKVEKLLDTSKTYKSNIFPNNPNYRWTIDNFGPVYVPKKGATVAINLETLPFYQRVIEEYEDKNNTIEVAGDEILLNGQVIDSYTFRQDYYWMMGDNRHNSEDSRYWGYVPYDHIVGKPVLIWWSVERFNPNNPKSFFQRIRWNRMFTTVKGEGEPTSYLIPVIIVLVLIMGYSSYKKRKNQ
ncbi:MAG: signal peptidase I [Flavobacteriia bacterium]|nr:MAG: signal peptidase I [Flavobacteriia bacterium]